MLIRSKNSVNIQDSQFYKRLTIRWYGNGCFLRDTVKGISIGTKKQFIVKEGQFVLSKIDARNGSFGFISKKLDGAIITANFWAYVNTEVAIPEYLAYLFATNMFMQFCRDKSNGLTNRKYLDESAFLHVTIPLPGKDAQIAFANKINEQTAVIKSREDEIMKMRKILEQIWNPNESNDSTKKFK